MLRFLKSRAFRQGSVATAITVTVIAIVVVLNTLVGVLDARYGLQIDLTEDKVFELSEESRRYVETLGKDVIIYLLSSEEAYSNSGDVYLTQANEVIRQYAALSDHITLTYIDLLRDPGFESRFPQYQLNYTTILLTCGDEVRTLVINDLYNTEVDYYTGEEYIVSSRAEQTMTSAIMSVTLEFPVTVTFLEGYGEHGDEALYELLDLNAYRLVRQNILTEEIDPSATVAVLSAPTRDWQESDLRKLDEWLYNSGDYGRTLLYFPSVAQTTDMPNLDAFLAEWGVEVNEGIVYQSDLGDLITYNSFWSFVDYTEVEYAALARSRGLGVVVPEARPLTVRFAQSGNRSVQTLLEFSDGAYAMPLDADESWSVSDSERQGPIPAMLLAQASSGYSASSVVVSGSYIAVETSLLSSTQLGNTEFYLSVIAGLSGRDDDVLSIAAKSIGEEALGRTAMQALVLGALFAVVVPLIILIWGAVVYLQRRHL